MVPVPGAPVGDRLLGWLIACVVSIPAVLLLWPPHPGDALRAAAARACRALAAELTAVAAGTDAAAARSETAAAISALARRAVATPYRSTGPTSRDLALVSLLDEIRWLHPFVERLSAGPPRWARSGRPPTGRSPRPARPRWRRPRSSSPGEPAGPTWTGCGPPGTR